MLGSTARTTGLRGLDTLDDQLVRAGRADEQAFAELYDQIAHRVYGLVLRVVGDPALAAEVTEEALVEIWRTSAQFDPANGSAMGWIVSRTHRRAVDRVRASAGTHQGEVPREGADADLDAARATFDPRSVPAALAALPPTQRRAVELAYFGGHTCADISRLLQVPLDVTMASIRTSLLGLRRQMSGTALEAT